MLIRGGCHCGNISPSDQTRIRVANTADVSAITRISNLPIGAISSEWVNHLDRCSTTTRREPRRESCG
jgi:hypothetical protein